MVNTYLGMHTYLFIYLKKSLHCDHLIVIIELETVTKTPIKTIFKRDWSNYPPTLVSENLTYSLAQCTVNWISLNVTEH